MTDAIPSSDVLLFVVLPYVAVTLFIVGTIERFLRHPYSVSSGSSQLLENRQHFWTVVPFHYGILVVALAHLFSVLVPQAFTAWNTSAPRLLALEVIGLTFGLVALCGFVGVFWRRLRVAAVRVTTGTADWIVYAMLLGQLATGVSVAIGYPGGSAWSTAVLTPYLWSLIMLQPDASVIAVLPIAIKIHVAGAFVLAAMFPFSRLVHVVDIPNAYLWRRPQVVRWYGPQVEK